ncbi:MAG: succinylglutamate desuccinylase/aspartoacylase family protein [Thermoanaerobaculia bacterium]
MIELPPRVVGRFGDTTSGPTLIVFGAVHGNEPAGYEALRSVFSGFEESGATFRGSVIGLVGNRRALAERARYIDEDLNRIWLPGKLCRIKGGEDANGELGEARELHRELEAILATASDTVYALDIHSTSGPGPAFSVFDDSLVNREFALELEVPMVLGIEEELDGTLLDYLNARGVHTTGFEAGQHQDEASIDRAEAAIWVALRASGVLGRSCQAQVDAASRRLAQVSNGLPALFEVRHRHAIPQGSDFRMRPGFSGFQGVRRGDEIAFEDDQTIRAPEDGLLLMPLYQTQGEDGFFIIRPVRRVWLRVSARLRRWRLERFVHLLPGVRRQDEHGLELRVNRPIARWLPLDFFHLLGYRRIAEVGRHLYLRRRGIDGVDTSSFPAGS